MPPTDQRLVYGVLHCDCLFSLLQANSQGDHDILGGRSLPPMYDLSVLRIWNMPSAKAHLLQLFAVRLRLAWPALINAATTATWTKPCTIIDQCLRLFRAMHRAPWLYAGDIQLSAQDLVGLLDPSTIPGGSPPPSQGVQQAASGEPPYTTIGPGPPL